MPALVKAIKAKRFKQARLLVNSGYDINDKDKENGHTALIASCLLEDERKACYVIKWLLRNEACCLMSDKNGLTALMHACKTKKPCIVELLLKEKDLDLNAQDSEGNSALLYSIKAGDLRVMKEILSEFKRRRIEGEDQANNLGETPLILAAKLGNFEGCDVLLADGKASPHARDFEMKMTADEWKKMATINDKNDSRKRCSELSMCRSRTGVARRRNRNCENKSTGRIVGENLAAERGGDNGKSKGQVSKLTINSPFLSGYRVGGNKAELEMKLLDKRKTRNVKKKWPKDGEYDGGDSMCMGRRNTTRRLTSQFCDFIIKSGEAKHTHTRGQTSQGLRNIVTSQNFEVRQGKSMSAPQRAYINHLRRLRKQNYHEEYQLATMEVKDHDWTKAKRQKSFIQDQLPSLLQTLADQQSPSYRVKATSPEPPKSGPNLSKENDFRRKYILKRFAKAGFASIMMSKLAGVMRKSAAAERPGKISPLLGVVRSGRVRSNSCKSDGSSQSSKSWWI